MGVPARRPRHRQGPGRRLARVPEELPDDDLRLLRHAHGRAGGAGLQGADEADRRPRARPGDLGDGEHAGPQGPRRRHGPFWTKVQEHEAVGRDGLPATCRSASSSSRRRRWRPIQKEALCIMCGCCVSECNSMESDPEFFGPAALAKGFRFVGDPRDQNAVERLEHYNDEHGIWDCTRCYFCNERCPKGVDPRDAIAKLGAESIRLNIDRDMGAKHALWFVHSAKTTGWLRETELVPKTQGIIGALKETKFAVNLFKKGKVPLIPHVADGVQRGAGALRGREVAGPATAPPASSRAERALAPRARARARAARSPRRRRNEGRLLQGLPRLALREGAGHLHTGTRAEARDRAGGAEGGHVLRRRRHPRGRAGLLPPPERAHPRLRRGDRLRHADDDLQRLHAQPAAGELTRSRTTTRSARG